METLLWKSVSVVSLIIAAIGLIIGIVTIDQSDIAAQSPTKQQPQTYPASCQDVSGPSGVYTIQSLDKSPPFQVFCDAESDGGGWTLVASVHENSIQGKCTVGDKWSSEQGANNPRGSLNWENKNVFGQLETLTSDDYKNPAYHNVPAKNIMLWHVPNEKKVYEIKDSAFLKYYTTNDVLQSKTLQNLYSTTLPLRSASGGLQPLIEIFNASSSSFTSLVNRWYNYVYDGGRTGNVIRDGGGDMYDRGNRVSFATDRENFTQIVYNTPYFLYGSGVEVMSGASYPFVTIAWIGQGLGDTLPSPVRYFDLKVQSNYGADGFGGVSTYPDQEITQGHMTGKFTAFNVVNTSDPSVCEVFFYVASTTQWNSNPPTSMQKISWGNTSRDAVNIIRFTGNPSGILVGYTLLSKSRGRIVTVSEVEAVVRRYMVLASDFNFEVVVPHIVAPISYILGDNDTILSGIPTLHRQNVVPGYIQFRAFNSVGLPNALCPGVSVNSDNPEQMCIGGSSTAFRDLEQCGDFAGWGGRRRDKPTYLAPSQTGKSLRDLTSSILIFVR